MVPQTFFATFSAFGLSASAGFNAWATLFIVALAARFGGLTLAEPYDVMANDLVVIALALFVLIEGLADKVPGVDHLSHALHTVIQPIAGAILFAAQSNIITDISPILGFLIGALAAGTIHSIRATIRMLLTASTGGMGNTIASFLEDLAAMFMTLLSLLVPLLTLIGLVVIVITVVHWWQQRQVEHES